MNKEFAFVFPGQGSQHLGMLNELASKYTLILDVFARASDSLGYDLWALTQEGPPERLNQTKYTQPALLAAGVSLWQVWKKIQAPTPALLAGHSLGEYTSLVCANAIEFSTAIKLVAQRGKFMQEAVPDGQGAMAAIIGMEREKVNEICRLVSEKEGVVALANFNSREQIVIAGKTNAIDDAVNLAKQYGAKLAKRLPVSVPSHCELMQPAALQLAEELGRIKMNQPELPIVNNVDVRIYQDQEQIKDGLIRQLYSPVRWTEIIQFFLSYGLSTIIESGPGKVLTKLNKHRAGVRTLAIDHPDSLQEALNILAL
jgi:[acyl-carrier-protein] S-malonyltransferase